MAECSEHFLNGLATIAAVNNAQLLQSNLVIMRHYFLSPRGGSIESIATAL